MFRAGIFVVLLTVMMILVISCAKDKSSGPDDEKPFDPVIDLNFSARSTDVMFLPDSTYILTGSSDIIVDLEGGDMFVLRGDLDANIHWIKVEFSDGNKVGEKIIPVSDSEFNVFCASDEINLEYSLIKYDTSGTKIQETSLPFINHREYCGIVQKPDLSYNVITRQVSTGFLQINNMDAEGSLLNTSVLGSDSIGTVLDYSQNPQGELYILYGDLIQLGGNDYDCTVIKYGIDGNLAWRRYLGSEDQYRYVEALPDGNYFMYRKKKLGTQSFSNLVWMSDDGQYAEEYISFPENVRYLYDIARTPENDIFYMCQTYFYTSLADPVIVHADSAGSPDWNWQLDDDYHSWFNNIIVEDNLNIIATGGIGDNLRFSFIPYEKWIER